MLRDGNPACGLFAATASLGFAGFFFSLLQPVLSMDCQPAVGRQGFQGSGVAWGNGHSSTQPVSQVSYFAVADALRSNRPRCPNAARQGASVTPTLLIKKFRTFPPLHSPPHEGSLVEGNRNFLVMVIDRLAEDANIVSRCLRLTR